MIFTETTGYIKIRRYTATSVHACRSAGFAYPTDADTTITATSPIVVKTRFSKYDTLTMQNKPDNMLRSRLNTDKA